MARRKIEDVTQLFLTTPLYEEVEATRASVVKAVLIFDGTLDIYCPGCKQKATFRGLVTDATKQTGKIATMPISPGGRGGGGIIRFWELGRIDKSLICTRASHSITYHFICEPDYIVKIGQYPSTADIEIGDTDKYELVLDRDQLKELNRGIGLVSHGVGIGAHVYLRRIFEGLVEEAHAAASKRAGWDEESYVKNRMAERIRQLDGLLPRFLSDNPRLYAILSHGVHELTEQECLANFEALKLCIEVILDEKLAERGQRDKAEAARKALAQIDAQKRG